MTPMREMGNASTRESIPMICTHRHISCSVVANGVSKMNMRMRLLSFVILAAVLSEPVTAQGVAVMGKVGTLGVGADVSLGITPQLAVRAGASFQPLEPSRTFDEIDFTLDLASPAYVALVDFSPVSLIRLSGGIVYFGSDHELRGDLNQSVQIGNTTYTPQQVGTLTGVFETKELAPYLGIGLGRLGGRRGLGFALDVGVAFQGEPDVELSATGPIATQPAFQQNLSLEEQNIQEDAKYFRLYPVISLALVFGF